MTRAAGPRTEGERPASDAAEAVRTGGIDRR